MPRGLRSASAGFTIRALTPVIMRASLLAALSVLFVAGPLSAADGSVQTNNAFPVSIRVNAAVVRGSLRPVWRFFGADEPNYAYLTNGKKLIGELGALAPKRIFFRAH